MTGWCRSPAETRRGSPTGSVASAAAGTPLRHLSDADKLRKVLLELVDTERAYVKVSIITHSSDVVLLSQIPIEAIPREGILAILYEMCLMSI